MNKCIFICHDCSHAVGPTSDQYPETATSAELTLLEFIEQKYVESSNDCKAFIARHAECEDIEVHSDAEGSISAHEYNFETRLYDIKL